MKNRDLAYLFTTLSLVGLSFSFWTASFAHAETLSNVPCVTKAWTFKRDLSKAKIRSILESYSREEVLQLAWGEMLRSPEDSLAIPVLQYLSSTEEHSLMRGYIKSMGLVLTNGRALSEAIEFYPKREGFRTSPLPKDELCSLYVKTVNAIQEEQEGSEK